MSEQQTSLGAKRVEPTTPARPRSSNRSSSRNRPPPQRSYHLRERADAGGRRPRERGARSDDPSSSRAPAGPDAAGGAPSISGAPCRRRPGRGPARGRPSPRRSVSSSVRMVPRAIARAEGGTLLLESADQLSAGADAARRCPARGRPRVLATASPKARAPRPVGGQRSRSPARGARGRHPAAGGPFPRGVRRGEGGEPSDSVPTPDAGSWKSLGPETCASCASESARRSVSQGMARSRPSPHAVDGRRRGPRQDAKRAFETRYVEGLLRRCSGNISRAARMAKKDRKDFYDVIRRTGVDPGEFRG